MDNISIQPCQKIGSKTFAFLVDRSAKHVIVLDNLVWAVACREIPTKVFAKEWKTVTLPDDKITKILDGLASYAIYAGMTPQAALYLPQLTPMSVPAIKVAAFKGEELLKRYETQAAIEEAADKAGRPLTGAALMSAVSKALKETAEITEETGIPKTVMRVVGRRQTSEERGSTVEGRRRNSRKAQAVKALAEEVSEDLAAAEMNGENPIEVVDKKRTKGRPSASANIEDTSASAMFKRLLKEQKYSDDEIFAAVQAKFGLSDDKRGYVQWNRNWLKKNEGIEV